MTESVSHQAGIDHAWRYYELHAGQRMSLFNFFVVFTGLLTTGLAASLQGTPRYSAIGVALGLLLTLLAFVFWHLDRRVAFLVKHSETALAALEPAVVPPEACLALEEPNATRAAKGKARLLTFGQSFRLIFSAMGVIGAGGAILSALRFAGVLNWT